MSRTVKIEIKESEEELKEMMNQQTHARFLERLQMLYWIKTKQFESLQETADRLGRSKSVLVCWLRNYRRKGLTGLLEWNYHGVVNLNYLEGYWRRYSSVCKILWVGLEVIKK